MPMGGPSYPDPGRQVVRLAHSRCPLTPDEMPRASAEMLLGHWRMQRARHRWGSGVLVFDLIGALGALAVCRDVFAPVVTADRTFTLEWLNATDESTKPASAACSEFNAETLQLLVRRLWRPGLAQVVDEVKGQVVPLQDGRGRSLDIGPNVARVFDFRGEGAHGSVDDAYPPVRLDRKDLDSDSFHRAIMAIRNRRGSPIKSG